MVENIFMIGIDYTNASIDIREKFSMNETKVRELSKRWRKEKRINGCIFITTCNRIELWVHGGEENIDSLKELLLLESNLTEEYRKYIMSRRGEGAVNYLMELTCGIHSQIFGEDQILTQVNNALSNAREWGCVDSALETLFRMAVTGAKKIKTKVHLTNRSSSVPSAVIQALEKEYGRLKNKTCLVIGNGEIGRLTASLLHEKDCKVYMTLRQYKTKEVIIPKGCKVIMYEERYECVPNCDFIFSATISPHYTLTKEQLIQKLKHKPYVFIDMAVPRDIEPSIGAIDGVNLYDMDQFGIYRTCNQKEMDKAYEIIKEYKEKYYEWYDRRDWIPAVKNISEEIGSLTEAKLDKEIKSWIKDFQEREEVSEHIKRASQKSIEKMILGMRDYLSVNEWKNYVEAMEHWVTDILKE